MDMKCIDYITHTKNIPNVHALSTLTALVTEKNPHFVPFRGSGHLGSLCAALATQRYLFKTLVRERRRRTIPQVKGPISLQMIWENYDNTKGLHSLGEAGVLPTLLSHAIEELFRLLYFTPSSGKFLKLPEFCFVF